MSAPVELSLQELLTSAWCYLRAAQDNGDILGEDKWLAAIDVLLDRMLAG